MRKLKKRSEEREHLKALGGTEAGYGSVDRTGEAGVKGQCEA